MPQIACKVEDLLMPDGVVLHEQPLSDRPHSALSVGLVPRVLTKGGGGFVEQSGEAIHVGRTELRHDKSARQFGRVA